jgi:hypothetical protein
MLGKEGHDNDTGVFKKSNDPYLNQAYVYDRDLQQNEMSDPDPHQTKSVTFISGNRYLFMRFLVRIMSSPI